MKVIDFKDAKCRHCYKCVRHCAVKAITVRDEQARIMVDHCINCGRCIRQCPMKLSPRDIERAVLAGDFGRTEDLYVTSCMECGVCSYVCPARRPLVQAIRLAKKTLRERRK